MQGYQMISIRADFFSNVLVSSSPPGTLPIKLHKTTLTVGNPETHELYDDESWASLIPQGHGFVVLGKDREYFALSMYHQMHCRVAHASHCLLYLRQMILCNADVTLEPSQDVLIKGKLTKAADGVGVQHQCRDWMQVQKFVEKNYQEWKDNDTYSIVPLV